MKKLTYESFSTLMKKPTDSKIIRNAINVFEERKIELTELEKTEIMQCNNLAELFDIIFDIAFTKIEIKDFSSISNISYFGEKYGLEEKDIFAVKKGE